MSRGSETKYFPIPLVLVGPHERRLIQSQSLRYNLVLSRLIVSEVCREVFLVDYCEVDGKPVDIPSIYSWGVSLPLFGWVKIGVANTSNKSAVFMGGFLCEEDIVAPKEQTMPDVPLIMRTPDEAIAKFVEHYNTLTRSDRMNGKLVAEWASGGITYRLAACGKYNPPGTYVLEKATSDILGGTSWMEVCRWDRDNRDNSIRNVLVDGIMKFAPKTTSVDLK